MSAGAIVCAIIPAKATSTRLPGKNLKHLAGKPMMAYIIEAAKRAKGVDRVIVTTESDEVKKIAEAYGAEVPFMRPRQLTLDDVTSQQVLQHALEELAKKNYHPDYALLLYPTSPLLKTARIEEAIRIALEKDSDSVISGTLDKGHYWIADGERWSRLFPKALVNSQQQEPLFKENGAIYLTKAPLIARQLVADRTDVLLMESDENIDVDYPEDFAAVERIVQGSV